MSVVSKDSKIMDILEVISRETGQTLEHINHGGCGVYASLIGSLIGYENFTPIAELGTSMFSIHSNQYYVDGNELVHPPCHILLLCSFEGKDYIYDSNGFTPVRHEILESSLDITNDYGECYVKITWESLIRVAQDLEDWNTDFDRDSDVKTLLEIIAFHANNNMESIENTDRITDFMNLFISN